jgi:hypothetical protein
LSSLQSSGDGPAAGKIVAGETTLADLVEDSVHWLD